VASLFCASYTHLCQVHYPTDPISTHSLCIEPYSTSCQILTKLFSSFFTLPLKRRSIQQAEIAACIVQSRVCPTKHCIYLLCVYESCANTTCLFNASLCILCLFHILARNCISQLFRTTNLGVVALQTLT
jgi:hypothetical protein